MTGLVLKTASNALTECLDLINKEISKEVKEFIDFKRQTMCHGISKRYIISEGHNEEERETKRVRRALLTQALRKFHCRVNGAEINIALHLANIVKDHMWKVYNILLIMTIFNPHHDVREAATLGYFITREDLDVAQKLFDMLYSSDDGLRHYMNNKVEEIKKSILLKEYINDNNNFHDFILNENTETKR